MTPYFLTFSFFLILTILDFFLKKIFFRKCLILIFGIVIVLFSALRWETGTDWENYLSIFSSIENIEMGRSGYEFFYELLVRLTSTFSNSYTLHLFITAIIIFLFTSIRVSANSPYPILSLLLLFSYSINSSGFGYRQDLAIALTFFSFYYVLKKRFLAFLLFVLTAALFHQSAMAFIPAYWVAKFKWDRKSLGYLVLIITILFLLIYLLLPKLFDIVFYFSESALGKLTNYNDLSPEEKQMGTGDPLQNIIRGLINRFLLIVPPGIIILFYKLKGKNIIEIFNLVFFSILLFVFLSPLGYVFLRFVRFYEIFHILLIPLCIYFSSRNFRLILFIFYIFYCILKFIYVIVIDNGVYVPYNSIFSY